MSKIFAFPKNLSSHYIVRNHPEMTREHRIQFNYWMLNLPEAMRTKAAISKNIQLHDFPEEYRAQMVSAFISTWVEVYLVTHLETYGDRCDADEEVDNYHLAGTMS